MDATGAPESCLQRQVRHARATTFFLGPVRGVLTREPFCHLTGVPHQHRITNYIAPHMLFSFTSLCNYSLATSRLIAPLCRGSIQGILNGLPLLCWTDVNQKASWSTPDSSQYIWERVGPSLPPFFQNDRRLKEAQQFRNSSAGRKVGRSVNWRMFYLTLLWYAWNTLFYTCTRVVGVGGSIARFAEQVHLIAEVQVDIIAASFKAQRVNHLHFGRSLIG